MKNNMKPDETLKMFTAIINNAIDKEAIAGAIVMSPHELKQFISNYIVVVSMISDSINQMVEQTTIPSNVALLVVSNYLENNNLLTIGEEEGLKYLATLMKNSQESNTLKTYQEAIENLAEFHMDEMVQQVFTDYPQFNPNHVHDHHDHDCDNCGSKGNCPIESAVRAIKKGELNIDTVTDAVLDAKNDPTINQDPELSSIIDEMQELLIIQRRLDEIEGEMNAFRDKVSKEMPVTIEEITKINFLKKEAYDLMEKSRKITSSPPKKK